MNIVSEIREGFASLSNNGALLISSLPDEYPGYVVRMDDGYGVAVKMEVEDEISERFNNCRLFTSHMGIGDKDGNYLVFSAFYEDYRFEFASLCAEFLDPGENGENRLQLINNPVLWWKKWKDLIGNASRDRKIYSVIAEMLVLSQKIDDGENVTWAAAKSGSHDIECGNESCEVKSTVKRYGATVTISSQFQLKCDKTLWLYFLRMEESAEGVSVEDLKKELIRKGYNESQLEIELEKQGLERGSSIRKEKYKVLEKRKYEVNDSFPRIVDESFKNDKFPDSIVHIEYTVDLTGLEYTSW